MKKTIALSALVLSILAGLVSGSLALYQKTVDVQEKGSVVAKKFELVAQGINALDTDMYKEDVKIAPNETVIPVFTVANFKDSYITETGMDLSIKVTLAKSDTEGVTAAIPYITAALLDENDNEIVANAETGVTVNNEVADGVGTITVNIPKAFAPKIAATNKYKIALNWVNHNELTTTADGNTVSQDYLMQGPTFGTKYTVSVTGTQNNVK